MILIIMLVSDRLGAETFDDVTKNDIVIENPGEIKPEEVTRGSLLFKNDQGLTQDYTLAPTQIHADHRGNPAYNMNLSKSRAQSVRNALIEAGISGKRISSHAHGEANAINKDREGLIFDRRVDIQLMIDTEDRSHSS